MRFYSTLEFRDREEYNVTMAAVALELQQPPVLHLQAIGPTSSGAGPKNFW
eukprot:CAMPEP_0194542944 /NCGR_PEP_ID=MMETSP0253-20130528/84938_1 /TAXON_ID=2966 /ORGANISM="Noctiluca scintillans" /LENGTH=50 /DNA_ID=CAMNT_0039389647 /DNA_START=114 /DNA_END=266 /DNA_ORIENTATION=-